MISDKGHIRCISELARRTNRNALATPQGADPITVKSFINTHACTHARAHTHIYIYIYIYKPHLRYHGAIGHVRIVQQKADVNDVCLKSCKILMCKQV